MKITCSTTFLMMMLLQGSQAFAPHQPPPCKTNTQLNESQDGWFGPAAAAVAGWAFAANVAMAGNPLPANHEYHYVPGKY